VKKTQRSFAVEYKHGRRRTDVKQNSIWGNLDLKSVALDVERSVMPMQPDRPAVAESDVEVSPPKAIRVLPALTAPATTLKAVAEQQEISMADENDTTANADNTANADAVSDAGAPGAVEAEPAPKKQRKPRMKKGSPETAAANTAAEGGAGQKRRGRKPKALTGVAAATREPVKRARKNEQAAAVEATSAGDDMADLLQLEEENQRLRKLLAEKLRAENADLRKKLNLG